jgi:DNA-binding phage protein
MGRRRGVEGPPASYVVSGQWPHGELGGPVAAKYVQAIARRLTRAIGDRSLRQVADDADLQHRTVRSLLSGESWPDVITVAKLEQSLGVRLWPDGAGDEGWGSSSSPRV